MDTLASFRVFCTVVELKGFTAAADRLGISPAMASKHVMQLENRLGSRLLNRTSRRVSLTEAGTLYFNQIRQVLESVDEVEAAIGNATLAPRGTLRLSAPVWFASDYFVGRMADYNRRYPDVSLDLDLSGRIVNLVDEGFDLALRATTPERLDPGLVARPIMDIAFRLMAAPDYLARTGRPAEIDALAGHAILRYSGIGSSDSLSLQGPDGPHKVAVRTVMQSDNETVLHLAALAGMGMVFLPTWMVAGDIAAGRLELLMPDTVGFTTTLYAVYPSRKYLSAKVRTFVDFMTESARRMPQT